MIDRIADALLVHVFYPATALVQLGEAGKLLNVSLFDTMDGAPGDVCMAGVKEMWLISNHPEGRETPYEEDCRNIRMLSGWTDVRLRLFLVSEYFVCREICLFSEGLDVL